MPACRNTAVIPLKADLVITDADLSDWAPPAYSPPDEFLTAPPLYTEMSDDDPAKPDRYSVLSWFYSTLKPWYDWANTHADGICKTYVTYEDGYVGSYI